MTRLSCPLGSLIVHFYHQNSHQIRNPSSGIHLKRNEPGETFFQGKEITFWCRGICWFVSTNRWESRKAFDQYNQPRLLAIGPSDVSTRSLFLCQSSCLFDIKFSTWTVSHLFGKKASRRFSGYKINFDLLQHIFWFEVFSIVCSLNWAAQFIPDYAEGLLPKLLSLERWWVFVILTVELKLLNW